MDDLRDKVAVITGGASGIGLATARALAAEGCRIVLADVEQAALEKAAAGLDALGVLCDVSHRESVQRLADATFGRFGAAHILFSNAGIATRGPIVEASHADWRWTIDVNLWGPIHGVEAFLPHMVEQRQGGHLLFTASFAGLVPNVGLGPYTVSKYGVVALAEVLQRELREHAIGVSVLCPMRVSTRIHSAARNRPETLGGPDLAPPPPDTRDAAMAGRILDAADVAAQVVAAVKANRLYILPHAESREPIRRRFSRIDASFEG